MVIYLSWVHIVQLQFRTLGRCGGRLLTDIGQVQAWVGGPGGIVRVKVAAGNVAKLNQVFSSHLAADYTLR